jgi:hypothetical protein
MEGDGVMEKNMRDLDHEQFLDELDDLIFRGLLEFCGDERLTITEKGKAAIAEARKES